MSAALQSGTINIAYQFKFANIDEKELAICLDKKTLDLQQTPRETYPDWTQLNVCKCPHCPLDENVHKCCPVAKNMVDVIEKFGDLVSHDETLIIVKTNERTFARKSPVSAAISSVLGIYMVTSGCPIMDKLRPMVRFHLPFASSEETTFRSISMYLFAQYYLHKKGKEPDWDLKKLIHMYEDISKVNCSFAARLREIKINDAALNALANLDCFAQTISFSVDDFNDDMIDELGIMHSLFKAYL